MNSTETSGLTRTEGPPVNRGAAVASATAISSTHRSTGIVIWNLIGRSTLEASYPRGQTQSFFELACVLVRLDHVARFIVNTDHGSIRPDPTRYSGVG